MGRIMQLASFSLAEVTYAASGDMISYLVQEQAKSASFKVKAKQENVSGVVLPAFEVDRVPGTGACDLHSSCLVDPHAYLHRFQSYWPGPWWSASSAVQGSVC